MAKILLSPKTMIPYGGKKHSLGQQFWAEEADAKRFVDGDMADRVVPVKGTKASRSAAEDARADGDAPDAGEPSGTTAVVTVS